MSAPTATDQAAFARDLAACGIDESQALAIVRRLHAMSPQRQRIVLLPIFDLNPDLLPGVDWRAMPAALPGKPCDGAVRAYLERSRYHLRENALQDLRLRAEIRRLASTASEPLTIPAPAWARESGAPRGPPALAWTPSATASRAPPVPVVVKPANNNPASRRQFCEGKKAERARRSPCSSICKRRRRSSASRRKPVASGSRTGACRTCASAGLSGSGARTSPRSSRTALVRRPRALIGGEREGVSGEPLQKRAGRGRPRPG
jgi:hypothetical protein